VEDCSLLIDGYGYFDWSIAVTVTFALSAIEFHGGTIAVDSEPNIGSTFTITIPSV
jgi:light-regulated signal transduction histidine kinase (bacteriophytochrome)